MESVCRRLSFTGNILLLFLSLSTQGLTDFSNEFDSSFRYSSGRFLARDWRQLKAQAIQESSLNPRAKSRAGAMGILQVMPVSWAMCERAMNLHASPYNAKANIICGAWHMARLDRNWDRRGRTDNEVWYLSLASYNAGIGRILQAQSTPGCENGLYWRDIQPCLYLVTGLNNSFETTQYVILIPRWYRQMR